MFNCMMFKENDFDFHALIMGDLFKWDHEYFICIKGISLYVSDISAIKGKKALYCSCTGISSDSSWPSRILKGSLSVNYLLISRDYVAYKAVYSHRKRSDFTNATYCTFTKETGEKHH